MLKTVAGVARSFLLDAFKRDEDWKARRIEASWNALAPKRVAGIRYEADGIRVLHPTKGWRFLSNKRLGIA